MNWYYAKNGAQQGPVALEDMKSRIAMGEIAPTDLAWREGMADWMPVSSIAELKVEAPPARQEPEAAAPSTPAYAPAPTPAASAPVESYRAPSAAPGAPVATQLAPGQVPSQGLAIASLVCGILALISCCFVGFFNLPLVIAAIVTGHMALSKAKADPGAYAGKGMAKAGLATGYVGLVGAIITGVLVMMIGSMNPQDIEKWAEDFAIKNSPPEKQQEIREQFEQQRKARGQ